VFVVVLFVLINPWYAISICAVMNLLNLRMNFWLFSVMFASSFALLFFLIDWRQLPSNSDSIFYLRSFQIANSISLPNIFHNFVLRPHGNEPFWLLYLWLSRMLIRANTDFFIFSNFFVMFSLAAYFGKAVDEKRYVVVISCILFANTAFLFNIIQLWRHVFALLFFFIGIFLFEKGNRNRLGRAWFYSSVLFHLVTTPFVILYEFFIFCENMRNKPAQRISRTKRIKWLSIESVGYTSFMLVFFLLTSKYGESVAPYFNLGSLYTIYSPKMDGGYATSYNLFNPLSFVVVFYFWFNRKRISRNDVFIGVNYFIIIVSLSWIGLIHIVLSRLFYACLYGTSILSARIMLTDLRVGSIFLCVMLLYSFKWFGLGPLSLLLGGESLNPFYGLIGMIYNYEKLFRPPW